DAEDDPARADPGAEHGHPELVEAEPREQDDEPSEREELRPVFEGPPAGDQPEPVRRRGAADLLELVRRQDVCRIETALDGDERLSDRRVKLRAEVPLDLCERLLPREPRPVRPLARHRVEAVGDDQEMRGEGKILVADAVVAAAVEALVVELDCARLRRDELEALEQTSGEPWMTAHRRPLLAVEAARLAEHGRIDGDLPEIVEPA